MNGSIVGVRFYKATQNTGTHIGSLWDSSGNLLASATFTNETSSGWQQVTFANPVPITAGTTYVAGYFAPNGHYSYTASAFASAGVDNAPLHCGCKPHQSGRSVLIRCDEHLPDGRLQWNELLG